MEGGSGGGRGVVPFLERKRKRKRKRKGEREKERERERDGGDKNWLWHNNKRLNMKNLRYLYVNLKKWRNASLNKPIIIL